MQAVVHYFLHFVAPIIIAYIFFKPYFTKASIYMLSTMLIDLDHLLSNPVFLANRCSIGYHLLHNLYCIPIYIFLCFMPGKIRYVGIGLLLHIVTDAVDCFWMCTSCNNCIIAEQLKQLLQYIKSI
jgi:hypothetical protein